MSPKLLTGASDTTLATLVNPATSCAGTIPANTAVGDVLIAFVVTQTALSGGQTFQENSGTWTLISPPYPTGSGKRPFGVWVKPIPDSAALAALTAPTFSSSATGRWIVRIARITGANTAAPADGASGAWETGNQTTTLTFANAILAKGNSLAFAVCHSINTAAQLNPKWTAPPAGFTTIFTDNTTSPDGSNSNDGLFVADSLQNVATTLTGLTQGVNPAITSISGFLVSIAAAPAPTQTPHVAIWTGSSEQPAYATVWDGVNEKPVQSMRGYPGDQTVQTLFAQTPFYIAHRGGSATYPEETVYGYTQCANMMMKALEISVWRSSDGVFVCSHDQNLSRVTGTSVDIPTSTWASMSGLTIKPVGTSNQAQPPRPIARIEDVLSRYGMTHVCFVEDKSGVNANALLTILDAYGGPSRHIWKAAGSFGVQAIVKSKGYKSWGYYFTTDQANFAGSYTPWDYIGLDFNMSDSTVTGDIAMAAPRPAIAHIIATTTQRDRMRGLGCVGLMTSAVDVVFPH